MILDPDKYMSWIISGIYLLKLRATIKIGCHRTMKSFCYRMVTRFIDPYEIYTLNGNLTLNVTHGFAISCIHHVVFGVISLICGNIRCARIVAL